MRTTITIDDDVFQAARSLAAASRISIGAAITELARRGLRAREPYSTAESVPVFSVSESAIPFGAEDVSRAQDDE